MAMNKKEREEMDRLKDNAEMFRALRWSDGEAPHPMDVEWKGGALVSGWFFNEHNVATQDFGECVSLGCSDGLNHSRNGTEKTTSQGRGVMYETKLLALRAVRRKAEIIMAKRLARVDRMIVEETERNP